MKVLIRVDASRALGTGHVMRELALADVLRSRGAAVSFACRTLDGRAADLISPAGFSLCELASADDEAADFAATARASRGNYDCIIVDDYRLGASWEREARKLARHIVVVDDIADRDHDCDLLIDQNLYEDRARRYLTRIAPACARLLGPHYAMLRPEFEKTRATTRVRTGEVRRLHVSFGGTDPTGQTLIALEAIAHVQGPQWTTDVVIGPGNPDCQQIEAAAQRLMGATCHVAPPNIAHLMSRADVALGSGGVSTNERMCVGLPAVVVATSALQEQSARDVALAGAHKYLGGFGALTFADYADALRELAAAPAVVRAMSAAGMRLVDGRGCERVAEAIATL